MAVLKVPVDFGHSVDFRGRHETPRKCYRIFVRGRIRGCKIQCPAGRRGRGDPSGASAPYRPRKAKCLVTGRDRLSLR
jgi:hypothetical protein